jgi:enoyl-CoA hydratase
VSERQKVLKEIQGRIALVTVNRPEALNALDQETLAELETVFSGLREDQSVGAVVLTGSGEKAFIAGADIRELSGLDPVAWLSPVICGWRDREPNLACRKSSWD